MKKILNRIDSDKLIDIVNLIGIIRHYYKIDYLLHTKYTDPLIYAFRYIYYTGVDQS